MRAKLTSLFFASLIFLFSFLVYLIIPWPEGAEYKESDVYSYYIYTDFDIKKSPRISGDYYFSYTPPDGGQRETSTITFTGGEPKILKSYLTGLGFNLYKTLSNGQEEIWLASDKRKELFSLWHNKNTNIISMTKTII